jgi:pimeloyl-ACP methyl ester carboxylesterase
MAGTSKNTMRQFGQILSNNRVQTFDKNVLSRAGTKLMSLLTPTTTQIPSEYDLHNVVVPVALLAGEIDAASPPKDNEFFVRTLPNVIDYEVIKGYGHYDFLLGNNCKSAFIEKIIDLLEE